MLYDAGPLGKMYIMGTATSLSQWQSNVVPGDRDVQTDLSNGKHPINPTGGWRAGAA
ncbi:MAG: hypothetical protein K2X03_27675 [Bryobacteraceae bacterium]|nr:hypothetical protein [Bryobacteraceae bacterium]